MKHKSLYNFFIVIAILFFVTGCSDFFGGNLTSDLRFKINLKGLQLSSRSTTQTNETAKLSVELISQDNSISLKQEQYIIDNTTDYFTFKNIKVGSVVKISATITQGDVKTYSGETDWLEVKPVTNEISLTLAKINNEPGVEPETTVKLTFISDDETYTELDGEVGTDLRPPETPTKTGYTFTGWNPALPDVFPETDATYTAQWTAEVSYSITYILNDGEQNSQNPSSYIKSETKIELYDPTKTGYTFEGWYVGENSTVKMNAIPAGKAEPITLYAKWTPITYTVAFNANGGTGSMSNQTFTYDEGKALAENTFTKTGYTFAGWNTKEVGTGTPYENATTIRNLTTENSATITLYAQWIPSTNTSYTVYHYQQNAADDNYSPADTENKTGTTGANTAAEAKSYTGFTVKDFTQKTIAADGSTVVEIYYDRNNITLTLDLAGGNGTTTLSGKYGATVTKLADPTKSGYNFAGWNPALPSTFPETNATYTAQWGANDGTIQTVNDLSAYYDSSNDCYSLTTGEYIFSKNLELDKPLYILSGNEVTICSNKDVTITSSFSNDNLIYIKGSLTLGNGDGNLILTHANNQYPTIASYGELTLNNNCAITGSNYCAIQVYDGFFYMRGGEIYGNKYSGSDIQSAAVTLSFSESSTAEFYGGKIYNNETNTSGGAIAYVGEAMPYIELTGIIIYNNKANNNGGGIYSNTANLYVNSDSQIYDNYVNGLNQGASIFVEDSLNDNTFYMDNEATDTPYTGTIGL